MSLGRLEGDVIVNFDAQDRASPKIKSATDRINQQYRKMRDEQRAVGRQFELNNRTFVQSARAIQSIGNIAQRGVGIWQSYTLGQIRLADAQRDLREIKRDLSAARASGDTEAQAKLADDEAQAYERIAQAQNEMIVNYILMGTTAAGAASQITTKVIPALTKLRLNLRGTNSVVNRALRTSSGAPSSTSGLPAEKTPIGTPNRGGNRGSTSTRGGGSGSKLFSAGSIALIPILEDIITDPDPLGRLMTWLTPNKDLGHFNLGGVNFISDPNANNPPLDVIIKVGNQTKTISLAKGSYAVE